MSSGAICCQLITRPKVNYVVSILVLYKYCSTVSGAYESTNIIIMLYPVWVL